MFTVILPYIMCHIILMKVVPVLLFTFLTNMRKYNYNKVLCNIKTTPKQS